MTKRTLIVESPTKAKTISRYLGSDYKVVSTVGHIRDLPKSSLGVSVEENFDPEYQVIKGKAKVIKSLKDAAKGADEIFLAPDPDREGEAIAWHVAEILKLPVKRVEFHEVTKKAILEALEHPHEINLDRVNAQQARRVLDRLVGYQISPLMWRKIKPGLSAGRVQSVAVRLICERELEIRAFDKQEYWTFEGQFKHDSDEFTAALMRVGEQRVARPGEDTRREEEVDGDSKQLTISCEADAEKLLADLKQQTYAVSDLSARKHSRRPAAPFTTSSMQQDAARKLGWTARRTMNVAQQLYEGIDLGSGPEGLITYMRTDSTRVNMDAVTAMRDAIDARFGQDYLPEKGIPYATKKKNAQDAHEAVRPTEAKHDPLGISNYLSSDQLKLYRLIYERFMASQMRPAEFETSTVEFRGGPYLFRTSATKTLFKGFLAVYGDERSAGRTPAALPPLKTGDNVALEDAAGTQHFTKPPPRFTDATLVKALEENGIGRPSTYAPIIETIIYRNYVVRIGRAFEPTEWGFVTNEMMEHYFPRIVDVGFTREMEEQLDSVEHGERDWRDVLGNFYGPFKERLDAAAEEKKYFKAKPKETEHSCDKCGAVMVLRHGKFGRFLSCSAYPKCENIKNIDEKGNIIDRPVSEAGQSVDYACPKCNSELRVKVSRWGTKFIGCSAYPKCDFTSELQTTCPKCKSALVKKRLKNRRVIFVCQANDESEGAKCDFICWGKPLLENCDLCGYWLAEQKIKGTDRWRRYCSKPECPNHRGIGDDATEEEAEEEATTATNQ